MTPPRSAAGAREACTSRSLGDDRQEPSPVERDGLA